jgi:hypothetical protein
MVELLEVHYTKAMKHLLNFEPIRLLVTKQNRMVWIEKLTINLFLTLHGYNENHQQRQLPKFHMCYQQITSDAYCGTAVAVSKMALQQEKAFCLLLFGVSRSVITVQREFLTQNSRCTVMIYLDTSKRSTQKPFSC